jgi:peptide/nickel transport system ATP-binding protein/oligopeptide transport system ATP-binding protein
MLEIDHLSVSYKTDRGQFQALRHLTFSINEGEAVGLAGESGSGKTTAGKAILRLIEPSKGKVFYQNKNILEYSKSEMRALRRELQIIWQDPYGSLNPSLSVEQIIGEGIDIHSLSTGKGRIHKISELMEQVGLNPAHRTRYPLAFSGGQRQRIGIARALAVDPRFIICDEPVSALDQTTQHQILQLLKKLQRERNLTYLLISHDLTVLKKMTKRMGVMYFGSLVEFGETETLLASPNHPYTQALISSILTPDPLKERSRTQVLMQGEPPSPLHPPKGCPFYNRCPSAQALCRETPPQLQSISSSHSVACHFPGIVKI